MPELKTALRRMDAALEKLDKRLAGPQSKLMGTIDEVELARVSADRKLLTRELDHERLATKKWRVIAQNASSEIETVLSDIRGVIKS